jgi:myo-inositol-1(or 4)-monophosphatase
LLSSTHSVDELRSTLFLALKRAGSLILKKFDGPLHTRFKNKSSINLVTIVDQQADRLIRKTILRRFPNHDLLTEESTPTGKGSPFKWIVDPLDGTTNYAHHFPQVGVSIGVEYSAIGKKPEVVLGGVYDPFRDELFWAAKGRGAWLEHAGKKKRLHVSTTPSLKRSLLLTGFPYDRRLHADLYLSYVKAFLVHIQGIRRAGAAALDLCWVACGRVDGYWEWRLKPWDCAAGQIIVKEAGGKLSDYYGQPHSIYGSQTLATNGKIHRSMLKVMSSLKR